MSTLYRLIFAVGTLAAAVPALSLPAGQGQGKAIVTVLAKGNREADLHIRPQDLEVKINGAISTVTGWTHMQSPEGPLEFVLLIDSGARSSLGTQIGEIQEFIKQLPPGSKAAIAYMQNGHAALSGPLSADPVQIMKGFHLPGGAFGQNGSPYFCLSDLAQHWPSNDSSARREVLMITNGIDPYSPHFDPEDPYLQSAVKDSVRAGLVVYAIYWANIGRADNSLDSSSGGQNLLQLITEATGGVNYWVGVGNPVSFQSYFKDLLERFDHQYLLNFNSPLRGQAGVESMKFSIAAAAQVTAPRQVFVTPTGQ